MVENNGGHDKSWQDFDNELRSHWQLAKHAEKAGRNHSLDYAPSTNALNATPVPLPAEPPFALYLLADLPHQSDALDAFEL